MNKIFFWIIFLLFVSFQISFAQEKNATGGIVNGKATYLPKPDYPQEAKDFCVDGIVEVQVLIGEDGNVISAEAISGDELLRDSAVEAAKKAKFRMGHNPVKVKGIIVYNFDSFSKCINTGIVNRKSLTIPKPTIPNFILPKQLQTEKVQIVVVEIVIDENGKVIYAKAIVGNSLLFSAGENLASQTRFSPIKVDGPSIKVKALLAYKFKSDGKIKINIEKDDKDVIGTPIDLVKPPPPFCNCRFGGNESILVEAQIDEKGNVTTAKAYNGHPILKNISEKAALKSKFLPAYIKSKVIIVYEFEAINNNREAKLNEVYVKEVKIEK